MDRAQESAASLSIVSFASQAATEALSRDVAALGHAFAVERGPDWLERKAPPPARNHVLLLQGIGRAERAAAERLATRPWLCLINARNAAEAPRMMRAATEFLVAPWTRAEFSARLERFLAPRAAAPRAAPADAPPSPPESPPGLAGLEIVGGAQNLLRCLAAARRAAASDAPVVIEGETGVGKELLARLIHRLGPRARRAFVPVNCGCLPSELVENELFGHEAGAYTGAGAARTGLVQQAEGGVLFLDEIDTLPARAQVALLRFLQQGEVRPVGGGALRRVDVRVIAASNRPLGALAAAGAFREDLYFRLAVLELTLPPLRERREDIGALARHFLARRGAAYGRPGLGLAPEAEAWLVAHDWPGNVRQLDNLIHRAVVTAEGSTVGLADIAPRAAEQAPLSPDGFRTAKTRAVDDFERRYLAALMTEAGGNVTAAAARAGKERRALGKLLKKHGLRANPAP